MASRTRAPRASGNDPTRSFPICADKAVCQRLGGSLPGVCARVAGAAQTLRRGSRSRGSRAAPGQVHQGLSADINQVCRTNRFAILFRVDTPAAIVDSVAGIHQTIAVYINKILFFTAVLVAVFVPFGRIIAIAGFADNGFRAVTIRIVLLPSIAVGR